MSSTFIRNTLLYCFTFKFLMIYPMISPAQHREPIDVHSRGPQVGDYVPGFSLADQHGLIQTLDTIIGPKGAMLLFHRSADW